LPYLEKEPAGLRHQVLAFGDWQICILLKLLCHGLPTLLIRRL
jgi:hypothetical protein